MRFSRFLGLYPNTDDYSRGCFFDMMNACFTPLQPSHSAFLKPEEASHINLLMRMNYETISSGTTFLLCFASDSCNNGCTAILQSNICLSSNEGLLAWV